MRARPGDDRVGEIVERVDDVLVAFEAALDAVEAVRSPLRLSRLTSAMPTD